MCRVEKLSKSIFIIVSFLVLNYIYSIIISIYFNLNIIYEISIMTLMFFLPLGMIPLMNVAMKKKNELLSELGDMMLVNKRMFKFNLGLFIIGCILVFIAALICAATTPEGPKLAFIKSISIFFGSFALMGYTYQLNKLLEFSE